MEEQPRFETGVEAGQKRYIKVYDYNGSISYGVNNNDELHPDSLEKKELLLDAREYVKVQRN